MTAAIGERFERLNVPLEAAERVIATWVFCDLAGGESKYPQVNGLSSTIAFQSVYWQCALVSLVSARLRNPSARLILFSNLDLEEAGRRNADLHALIDEFEFEYVEAPAFHTAPEGWHGSWRNQFYVFDVLKWCTRHLAADASLVITDGDCLWHQSGEPLFVDLDSNGLASYVIGYPADKVVNGLTRFDLAEVSRMLGYKVGETIEYSGGELIALRVSVAGTLIAEFERVWPLLLAAHEHNEMKFNEEAQLLSALYAGLGIHPGRANPYIKRMWTALRFSNLAVGDSDLMIWHLPAEKEFGFARAYSVLLANRHRTSAKEFSVHLEACFDVQTRKTVRRVRDDSKRLLKAVTRRLAGY